MDTFSFTAKTRVFRLDEVQVHGVSTRNGTVVTEKYDETSPWHQYSWVSSHGLPAVEDGKKVVILFHCDCGCRSKDSIGRAIELINKDTNPERFVLSAFDPRYTVERDGELWLVSDRPPQYTGAG